VKDLQGQLVQASKAYETMKDKKEKYQTDMNKYTKANTRLRSEKEDLEKVIADLNAEIERLNIVE
jgi:chromosome segregation ATPase